MNEPQHSTPAHSPPKVEAFSYLTMAKHGTKNEKGNHWPDAFGTHWDTMCEASKNE